MIHSFFNPFLFIKNKRFLYPRMVSPLGYLLRGQCFPSNRAADSNGSLAHFEQFELPLLLAITDVWRTSYLKKMRQMAITICRGLSHPIRSLSRIVCRGQEGPKFSKGGLLGLISWPILVLGFVLKVNVTARYRKEVVGKSRYSWLKTILS